MAQRRNSRSMANLWRRRAVACVIAAIAMMGISHRSIAQVTVGAMGDSYSDETMAAGIPNWTEILVAGGRADFGPSALFPSGDPRHSIDGVPSYTYNFAHGGHSTEDALGHTTLFPSYIENDKSQPGSPNRTDLWPGIRGAGLNSQIQYASQELGGIDILELILNENKLLLGLDVGEMNAILGRADQITRISTADFTSPLGMVMVTYPDIGSMPIVTNSPYAPFGASIRANVDYFNNTVRGYAALHGFAVVELWDLWETAKSSGITVHGIPIDTYGLGSGTPQDLDTMFLSDGLHPTPIFQALWANEFIKAVNATYGESIPELTEKEMVTLSLLDPQQNPIASAGGAYEIFVNGSLSLDGSGSTDPNPGDVPFLTHGWELSGDASFDDAVGSMADLTWTELYSLGITGPGTYDVDLLVDDTFGGTNVAMTTLTVSASAVGDISGDGQVDIGDFTLWADDFGATGAGLPSDVSGDGQVDIGDFTLWGDHFGETASLSPGPGQSPTAVPEPASVILLLIGVAALAPFARKSRSSCIQ